MEQMKSINYQNSIDDLRDYYRFWAFSSEPGRRWVRNFLLFFQGVYIVMSLLVWGFSNSIWLAAGLFLVFEFGLLIRTRFKPRDWLINKRIENYLKNVGDSDRELFTQPKLLEITNEALRISNQDWSSSISWKIIRNIDSSPNTIFIHYGLRSMLIIPRRSFDSITDFESFHKEISGMMHINSSDHVPNTPDVI